MSETRDGTEMPLLLAVVHRFFLPVLFLTFGVMYFFNTWGRIRPYNLQYPYFALSILLVASIALIVEEAYKLYRDREEFGGEIRETIETTWKEWHKSIKIVAYSLVFVAVIDYLGFIVATFVYLLGGMKIAGVRSWAHALVYSVLSLILVYVTFIYILGMWVPKGPFGI